jgi:hypothetical protein
MTAMLTPVFLLALDSPPAFGDRLDGVQVDEQGDSAEIVAFDSAGIPIGIISVWADSGVIHVDSDYDDGHLYIAIVDGEPIIDSTLDPAIAGERAALLGLELDKLDPDIAQAGWGGCAFAATGTVIAAVTANPWVIGGAIAAACSCLPMIVEEFEDLKCPYW